MKIIQFTPTISIGDAVSNDVRAIRELLNQMGYPSEIYVNGIRSLLPGETVTRFVRQPKLEPDDIFIMHHSIACDRTEMVRRLNCRKVLVYHNITPEKFFLPYDLNLADLCRRGLKELSDMSGDFSYALADSEFNRQDLLRAGYTCPIDVLPILVPFEDYWKTPDADTVARFSDGKTNILFVGRIAPNKKIENVISAFDCYKKTCNPNSRLILVGANDNESYNNRLQEFMRSNQIEDVVFSGHISFAQVLAFYKTAHVFLCMSEHEGFCVPLLEAMFFDIPIVAYDSCAVPYTLGGSGLLLPEHSPQLAAAAIDRLMTDEALRSAILEGQRRRLEDFSYESVSKLFKQFFGAFLDRS